MKNSVSLKNKRKSHQHQRAQQLRQKQLEAAQKNFGNSKETSKQSP